MMKQAENKMTNPEAKNTNVSPEFQALRKPYVKPAFEFEQVFETQALTCAPKNSGRNGACTQNFS